MASTTPTADPALARGEALLGMKGVPRPSGRPLRRRRLSLVAACGQIGAAQANENLESRAPS
jgi:hypothetical protein